MKASAASTGALVERVAELVVRAGIRVGVAESLTGGMLSSQLARGSDTADWFRGAVTAYAPEVKFDVLGVDPGPVNSARCARQMAQGAVRLLGAEVAVAATGVGGPGPDEGVPAGTVFLACADWTGTVMSNEHSFDGPPGAVVEAATAACLELLLAALDPSTTELALWRDCRREGVGPQIKEQTEPSSGS